MESQPTQREELKELLTKLRKEGHIYIEHYKPVLDALEEYMLKWP